MQISENSFSIRFNMVWMNKILPKIVQVMMLKVCRL